MHDPLGTGRCALRLGRPVHGGRIVGLRGRRAIRTQPLLPQTRRRRALCIGLTLQDCVRIDLQPTQLHRRLDPPLLLLHHMPGFMRQVLLLPRPHMDVRALRIRPGRDLGRLSGIVMDLHIVQGQPSQSFDPGFQGIGQAGLRRRARARRGGGQGTLHQPLGSTIAMVRCIWWRSACRTGPLPRPCNRTSPSRPVGRAGAASRLRASSVRRSRGGTLALGPVCVLIVRGVTGIVAHNWSTFCRARKICGDAVSCEAYNSTQIHYRAVPGARQSWCWNLRTWAFSASGHYGMPGANPSTASSCGSR